MWCDTFDGDLYALVPGSREVLEPVGGLPFATVGYPGPDGRLTHPSVWNHPGPLSFVAYAAPCLVVQPRSDEILPPPFVSDKPVITCTLEELVRDAWVHHYALFWAKPQGALVCLIDGCSLADAFESLLWDCRGWTHLPPVVREHLRERVLAHLAGVVRTVERELPGALAAAPAQGA